MDKLDYFTPYFDTSSLSLTHATKAKENARAEARAARSRVVGLEREAARLEKQIAAAKAKA